MRPIAVLAAVCTVGTGLGIAFAQAPASSAPTDAPPAPGPVAVFPPDWFFYGDNPDRLATLQRLDGKPAAELKVKEWLVGEPTSMERLRGKIVLLDFWGTWCGPCIQALPHTNEIAHKYADRGVAVLAICDDTRGAERAPQMIERLQLTCPVAMDSDKGTYRSYLGQWFPFYVIVDRNGAVRASGLNPQFIESAIDALLIEQPFGAPSTPAASAPARGATPTTPPPPSTPVPSAPASAWFEGTPAQRNGLAAIQGQPALPLEVISWINTDPTDLEAFKGKVVLLDFWGTWCAPCLQSVPHVNALHERYGPEGLVIIGVCHSKDSAKMADMAKKYNIAYPIAADSAGATFKAFRVNGTPDYYLIDRAGVLRFADVTNQNVEDAVRLLLAEPAPGKPATQN